MRKSIEIENQYNELLLNFYNYFDTGYIFEDFLKFYLEKIGLDEVFVTQRSRDGGIDLLAKRSGIGEFSEADEVQYYVQAKRYKPGTKIQVKQIRELKGTIPFGHKGLFITTADFTSACIDESNNDPSKPVILVDGHKLIDSCIEHEIGFIFKPVFSTQAMDELFEETENVIKKDIKTSLLEISELTVEKIVSTNDIRARILRIPSIILKKIPNDVQTVDVFFYETDSVTLTIDKTRTYFAGITDTYRKYKLLDEDGSYCSKKAIWNYIDNKIVVFFKDI